MFEKFVSTNPQIKMPKGPVDLSKRKFLKAAVVLAGGALVGPILKNKFVKELAEEPNKNSVKPNNEKIEAAPDNPRTVDEILNLESTDPKDPITINKKVILATKEDWTKAFLDKSKSGPYLLRAYKRMKQKPKGGDEDYISILTEIFKAEGIPEKFIFLAIVESGFKNKKSSANAKGPFQFIAATARALGLIDEEGHDHRSDPIMSGQACAKLLRELYKRTGDWDLALSGYNGNFIKDYLSNCKRSKEKPNYEDFLSHLSRQADELKNNYHGAQGSASKEIIKDKINGLAQNLNYPAKVKGAINALEALGLIV
jgi:hypothetical protein